MSQSTARKSPNTLNISAVVSPRPSISPAFVRHSGPDLAATGEDGEGSIVDRPRAYALVQPRNGLDVVIQDVDRRLDHRADGADVSLKIGHQHLDAQSPERAP